MPFFGGSKDKKKKKETRRVEAEPSEEAQTSAKESANGGGEERGAAAAAPATEGQKPTPGGPPKELAFAVQLAHGSATKKVKNFTNVRQLYQRIAVEFTLPPEDVSEGYPPFKIGLNSHAPATT